MGLFLALVLAGVAAAVEPYGLQGTHVRRLRSEIVGSEYELFVSLPPGYEAGRSSYPVVLLLDANYSFALLHNVVRHLVDRDGLPPMILVGVAYPGAAADRETYRFTRTRDYTPTHVPKGGYGERFQKHSGGADRFLDFVGRELAPYLRKEFRASSDDLSLVGHSYGGLLAAYALFTRPALFRRVVSVSPSLWYDKRAIFRIERAATAGKVAGRAFFAIGAAERESVDRYDMVKDVAELVGRLKGGRYPGLEVGHEVFSGEGHDSVFPAAATRGLRFVFASAPKT